ncbi:MAG TPA: hypothetical protein VG166_07060 [Caulobacteraceae bacterium]|jgi:hypothetical protein|nr:hypothetical protein [Caulobacteraceae bacterium]
MRAPDAAGLVGVILMLWAYIGAQNGRMDPTGLTSLLMNLIGPGLVIFSLLFAFNLPAFLTEAAWAAAATIGLVRLALKRRAEGSKARSPTSG